MNLNIYSRFISLESLVLILGSKGWFPCDNLPNLNITDYSYHYNFVESEFENIQQIYKIWITSVDFGLKS